MPVPNVALREVEEGDLPTLYQHQRDPQASAMAAFPARPWEAFETHWQTRILGISTSLKKAVLVEGELAGYVGSWDDQGSRLLGYWIGRAFWGRGVATLALRAFLRDYELTRPVSARVAVGNAASIRVLEKCGFEPVGPAHAGEDGVEEWLMRLATHMPCAIVKPDSHGIG